MISLMEKHFVGKHRLKRKTLKVIIWIGIGIITVFNIATGFNIKGFRDSLMLKVQYKISNWLKE